MSSEQEKELVFRENNLKELEDDFQKILDDLAGEQSLDKFRVEYEKLHRSLKKSYENEKLLLQKISQLNQEIVGGAAKIQGTIKLTQQDGQTITQLKQKLDQAFQYLQKQRGNEDQSKQKIEQLKTEVKHLTSVNEEGTQNAEYKNNRINQLTNEKEEIMKKVESLSEDIEKQKKEMAKKIQEQKNIEQDKLVKDTLIKEEEKALREILLKVKKDEERKEQMRQQHETMKQNYQKKVDEKTSLELETMNIKKKNEELQNQKNKKQQQYSDLKKQYENIQKSIKHYKKNYTENIRNKKQKLEDMDNTDKPSKKLLESDNERLEKEISYLDKHITQTLEKNIDKLKNDLMQLNQKQDTATRQKQIAIASVNQLERQVADAQQLNKQDIKFIDELKESQKKLEQNLAKVEDINKKQAYEIKEIDNKISEYEKEIYSHRLDVDKLTKKIEELAKVKEKFGKQAALANAKYFHGQEEIKLKDNLISEFQKKNLETEQKLRQQQTLYEAVRSDRNLYSKQLSETQDEIAEIKRRYKIVNHQISQLKEEIDAKEVALAKEHFEHKKKDKTIEEHSRVLEKYRKDMNEKEEKMKNFIGEISKLQFIIRDSESLRSKLKDEYESVVADRDILGTQLIRRNDESALLYEKIKIQQRTLAQGEAAYRERLGDQELLRYKINDLVRALQIYKKQVGNIPKLQTEIHNLQKELIQEKVKVKALSEELENPLNTQRCNKLEGSDPDIFEMRSKLQTLQRRLIQKTEQVVEKEVLIQQKEKQIQELREIMKRQPGIEDAKKISSLQQSLKSKTRQMKALASELNMYQAQVNEYKYDIERLNKEVQEVKRKYYEQRKREQLEKEQEQYFENNENENVFDEEIMCCSVQNTSNDKNNIDTTEKDGNSALQEARLQKKNKKLRNTSSINDSQDHSFSSDNQNENNDNKSLVDKQEYLSSQDEVAELRKQNSKNINNSKEDTLATSKDKNALESQTQNNIIENNLNNINNNNIEIHIISNEIDEKIEQYENATPDPKLQEEQKQEFGRSNSKKFDKQFSQQQQQQETFQIGKKSKKSRNLDEDDNIQINNNNNSNSNYNNNKKNDQINNNNVLQIGGAKKSSESKTPDKKKGGILKKSRFGASACSNNNDINSSSNNNDSENQDSKMAENSSKAPRKVVFMDTQTKKKKKKYKPNYHN
ncbi:hypothetical protein PPERSA_02683 [Pseudocohnilembus persalinus]|uniref:Cilia- and flagella-associated protein 58 central coiled coil domain-containing protein n=1 Tax=Pseudocohnilembus persalinus TaxID=266149 RepID=A0A0V0R5Q1_PSEPJ|nr:hypothetical protein PPERSA_02683 [Pseudocohnilembus persalinus]|eukprot:KRX09811.1 hypothetical protein PPERSA_02683 [Pseudocohnilembus persalinus]